MPGIASPPELVATEAKRRQSLILVFCCTILGAAAQVLMKFGAQKFDHPGILGKIVGILTNPPLFAGYSLYGLSTVLLAAALRYGQLSLLYPVIALTYVWVSILSVVIFQETMTPLKVLGIATIVTGVAILGRGNGRPQ
jgi:multidrug transporter EmrE-like cation transporter